MLDEFCQCNLLVFVMVSPLQARAVKNSVELGKVSTNTFKRNMDPISFKINLPKAIILEHFQFGRFSPTLVLHLAPMLIHGRYISIFFGIGSTVDLFSCSL